MSFNIDLIQKISQKANTICEQDMKYSCANCDNITCQQICELINRMAFKSGITSGHFEELYPNDFYDACGLINRIEEKLQCDKNGCLSCKYRNKCTELEQFANELYQLFKKFLITVDKDPNP